MKRFRILGFEFDARVHHLTVKIEDDWEERVKETWRQSKIMVEQGLIESFGVLDQEQKKENYIAIGDSPFSILAFHNRFFSQVREAFVVGAYYPALTAACALGERILNYLVMTLRDDFKFSSEYKKVYNKNSFDHWDLPIDTLESWGVLLPETAAEFRLLRDKRNRAIHFRPEVDQNDRELALAAILNFRNIIENQFAAFEERPWFLAGIPGENFIKKEWETRPFIKRIYLPNCLEVGPHHIVESIHPWKIRDRTDYENRELTDDEFRLMRIAFQEGGYKSI